MSNNEIVLLSNNDCATRKTVLWLTFIIEFAIWLTVIIEFAILNTNC